MRVGTTGSWASAEAAGGYFRSRTAEPALIGYKVLALLQSNQAAGAAPLMGLRWPGEKRMRFPKSWFITLQTEFGKEPIGKPDAIRKFAERCGVM